MDIRLETDLPQEGRPSLDIPAPAVLSEAVQAPYAAAKPAEEKREEAPRLEEVRRLAENIASEGGGAADPGPKLDLFYAGAGEHDHALLGFEGNAVVVGLVKEASGKLAPPGKGEEELYAPKHDRIWSWIELNQSVRRVPFYSWLSQRRRDGLPLPRAWTPKQLEAKLETLNDITQLALGSGKIVPHVALQDVKILVDDLSDGLSSRASIQERLRGTGREDIRDVGAFNLFGDLVVAEDLALFPGMKADDLLAVILHETLAAAHRMSHWEVVGVVRDVIRFAFESFENDVIDQNYMEKKVRAARRWGDNRGRRAAEAASIASENGFDTYALPFKPRSLRVDEEVGAVDDSEPHRPRFKRAFVYFSTPRGLVALGIESAPDSPVSLHWQKSSDAGNGKWLEIELLTGEDMLERSLHAQFNPRGRRPGPMLSYGRFHRELLGEFDRAVREFVKTPGPELSIAFVEQVYGSFRRGFSNQSGLPLPELHLERARRLPPHS